MYNYISYSHLLNNRFRALVTATIERHVADMNYVTPVGVTNIYGRAGHVRTYTLGETM